jgi:hypothetical protein
LSLSTRQLWRTNYLKSLYPTIASEKLHRIFSAYQLDDLDLATFWSLNGTDRCGHHYIIGIHLGVHQPPLLPQDQTKALARSLYEQTEREKMVLVKSILRNKHMRDESPIKVMLKAVETVQHDFRQQPYVPICSFFLFLCVPAERLPELIAVC